MRLVSQNTPRTVLITDADQFLGPAAVDRFRDEGDAVTALTEPLRSREQTAQLVGDLGPFDVLIANLEAPITVAPITEHDDATVSEAFSRLVDPLFWLFAACLPGMIQAGGGAVVVPTSATAIRNSTHPIAAYQAARAAQISLVRSVGREMAHHRVRVNGVAVKPHRLLAVGDRVEAEVTPDWTRVLVVRELADKTSRWATLGVAFEPLETIVLKLGFEDRDVGADRWSLAMGYVF